MTKGAQSRLLAGLARPAPATRIYGSLVEKGRQLARARDGPIESSSQDRNSRERTSFRSFSSAILSSVSPSRKRQR